MSSRNFSPPLALRRSFRGKILSFLILIILTTSVVFTSFFVSHERDRYDLDVESRGKLLARLLAHQSRLGVFAGNGDVLENAAAGVIDNRQVVSAAVFGPSGEQLAERVTPRYTPAAVPPPSPELLRRLSKVPEPVVLRSGRWIAFYAAVVSPPVPTAAESLLLDEEQPLVWRFRGAARVVLDGADVDRQQRALVTVAISIALGFLVVGTATAYFILHGLTKPLNLLFHGVKTLEQGELSARIPITSEDEIGKISVAFNHMSATLERREAEKRQLEEQLILAQKMEARREWERTFDAVPDLIAILDAEFCIRRLNRAMADRLGIDKDAAIGSRPDRFLFGGIDAGELLSSSATVVTELFDEGDGSYFHVTVSPISGTDGDLSRYVLVARDITKRKADEEERRLIQAKLVQANKMTALGQLVAGVAHEVNNPNNSIMLASQLVAGAWQDAAPILERCYKEEGEFFIGGIPFSEARVSVPRHLARITESSRRIEGVIRNLKDLVVGKTPFMTRVQVNRVVNLALSILNPQIRKSVKRFNLQLLEGLPDVRGNMQQLEQVMINLVMNAIQALPDRERGVTVATFCDIERRSVYIEVTDEGVGIPAEAMDRLFEPFFSTKVESGGTGLGLSISRSIIEEHNGSLTFRSRPGEGTTATVQLPAIQP